ncbi:hypothetical protein J6590_078419 [Homalodisca vitripennis]|nr:hypothetical protein J6590_078419 [Homalodisca vitripennis]
MQIEPLRAIPRSSSPSLSSQPLPSIKNQKLNNRWNHSNEKTSETLTKDYSAYSGDDAATRPWVAVRAPPPLNPNGFVCIILYRFCLSVHSSDTWSTPPQW